MSSTKIETDIILNKANIALARSQRLVASWLPAETTDEINTKSDAELQEEEDEVFTAVPETLGLGAPLPSKAADGSWNRAELDSNDALRRQLLGRNYKKVMAEKEKARQQKAAESGSGTTRQDRVKGTGPGNDQRGSTGRWMDGGDDDDEEDEGRAASIGKKSSSRKRNAERNIETASAAQTETTHSELRGEHNETSEETKTAMSQQRPKPKGRKMATSFLDELLAERSKKRKKR